MATQKATMRKNIDPDKQAVKIISKAAIDTPHGNFKNYVEDLILKEAARLNKKKQ